MLLLALADHHGASLLTGAILTFAFVRGGRDRRSPHRRDDDLGMATEDDVRRIALDLPSTTEKPSYGMPGFRVKDKLFARMREGHDEEVLVLWVESEEEKHALIAEDPDRFFTVPHYDGHSMVLARLAALDADAAHRAAHRRAGGSGHRRASSPSSTADRSRARMPRARRRRRACTVCGTGGRSEAARE